MRPLLLLLLLSLQLGLIAQTYPIGQITRTVTDANRGNRSIDLEIFYPATVAGQNEPVANGSFPVIVFGHGFSMNYDPYNNFWEELVPQGFIMVFPKTEIGPIPFPDHATFGEDLSFVAALMQQYNADNGSEFFQRITDKTAVMGHSMGGGASFLAAANNPDFATLISFAPAETNPSSIEAATDVTQPALIFAGANDNVAPPNANTDPMYDSLASACKILISVNGASHCQFANSNIACDFGETTVCIGCSFIDRAVQHEIVFRYLIPWLEYQLKGNCPELNTFYDALAFASDINYQQSCNAALPIAGIDVLGNSALCNFDSTELSGTGVGSYLWSTGDTTQSITLSQPGTFNLIVTGENNCSDTASATITANGVIQPIVLTPQGDSLCEGLSTALSSHINYADIQWNTGDTLRTILVSQTGYYQVSVVDANGCPATSDSVLITFVPNDLAPAVVSMNDTLFFTEGELIGWYFNGQLIQGFSEDFLLPLSDGYYQVAVVNELGCEALSDSFLIETLDTIDGIFDQEAFNISIYPNPASGVFTIKADYPVDRLILTNTIGQIVLEQRALHSSIDITAIPSGVYIAIAVVNGQRYTQKVIIH